MTIPFREAPFTITGGTTARSLDERFSDIINVKEFGATGDGSTNDAPAIQAAFDLAFGPSSAPHGEDNAHLNKPVFIPAGDYKCNSPLLLTRVVGGHIYGAGAGPTLLRFGSEPAGGATITPLIHINGAVGLRMEHMQLRQGGGGGIHTGLNNPAILLDWDGESGDAVDGNTGGGGLRFNQFTNMAIGGGEYVVIIGREEGLEGYNNLFTQTFVSGVATTAVGIDVRGPEAITNSMNGGGVDQCGGIGVNCPVGGGSMHAQGCAPTQNGVDFVMASGKVMYISQLRTESHKFVRVEDGIVMVQAFTTNGGAECFEVNGGKLIIEGSQLQDFTNTARVIGTGGEVYVNAIFNGPGPATGLMFADYSGTIAYDPENWEDL